MSVRAKVEAQFKEVAKEQKRTLARLAELPKNRPLLVFCAGGYRSSIAASLLQRHGFTDVTEIAGGFAAWETAGLPVEMS